MKFKTVVMTTRAEMEYIRDELDNLDIIEPYREEGIEIETTDTSITFTTKDSPIKFEFYDRGRELTVNTDWSLPISDIQGILVVPIVEE